MTNRRVATASVITVPGRLWTANALRRSHWTTRRRIVEQWRHDTAATARAQRVRTYARAVIEVRPQQARGRLADPGAHEPAAKAAIDGLVDAGVLPDDTGEHVVEVRYHAPVRSEMRMAGQLVDCLVILLREAP